MSVKGKKIKGGWGIFYLPSDIWRTSGKERSKMLFPIHSLTVVPISSFTSDQVVKSPR